MNKKFSTLVATLLLSGALFTLNAAVVSDISSVNGVEVVAATETTPKTIKFIDDVVFGENGDDYLIITEEGTIVDGNGKTLTGHLVINAEKVTVKNLTIKHNGGPETFTKSAISVFASSVTITGNTIECKGTESYLANGIILFPTKTKVEYNVSGNTIKNASNRVDKWQSFGIKVAENAASTSTLEGFTASEVIDDFNVATISNNTYENCACDYLYKNDGSDSEKGTSLYKAAQVTPVVGEEGSILNTGYVKSLVKSSDNGANMKFNGTAEQLAAALDAVEWDGGETAPNVAIQTNDGLVVSGAKQLETPLNGFDLVTSPKTGDYYLLVVRGDEGSYAISADETGKPTCYTGQDAWSTLAEKGEYLWTMSETKDADGDYTFVFTNKVGVKLKVNGEEFVQSVGKTPYNANGVAFNLNGTNLDDADATAHYFGLYRLSSHNLSAGDMNALQNNGFYVSFTGVEGTDAFAGLLTAEGTTDAATEFKLKNADGKYIIATAKNVEGSNVNQYVYAFELTDDATKANNFKFFHTPSAAIEDHLMIDKIDSIQVEVPTATANVKGWATLGTYKLTTDGTVTLGASIETKLNPVTISLNNNVVDPAKFLKNGYVVIKQLADEDDKDAVDLFVVATGCNDTEIALAEAVANDLEKQWVIAYNTEKKEYTLTNRENGDVKKENIAWTQLRENPEDGEGYDKDNIYVYSGQKYEITFHEFDASSVYYKYLSESADALNDSTFVMSYWSTVFDGYANVAVNKDGVTYIDTKAAQVEFKATSQDTVKAEVGYTYWTGSAFKNEKAVLKAPIYKFTATSDEDDSFGLQGGKYGINAEYPDAIVIRKADNHFNLITVKEDALEGKIYAGNNDSYMYKASCMYDDNKNTLFVVETNKRPEYRRFGKTIEDGFNDMEGDLNKLKFFRTNDENTFLYENSANKNANNGNGIAKDSLNFLGETNLADKSASAQLPFLVDTAYIRDNTRKPLYMLAVRAGEWEEDEIVVAPCDASNHTHVTVDREDTDDAWKCIHATRKKVHSRKGEYLVTLADSAKVEGEVYNSQALYQGNVRLAFVPATHFENDTLVIESSIYTGTKEAANDTLCFVDENGKQQMNEATFAFRLVDPTTVDDNKAEFYIEAMPTDEGKAQYVRIHNSVPVLVTDLDQAAVFDVLGAEEGEEATANEGIETTSVKVIAGNGVVTVKGAAGKNVVITNVLGQTIANTVVASDEATIAAPAGVVVVAVEGEDAVKAIVK